MRKRVRVLARFCRSRVSRPRLIRDEPLPMIGVIGAGLALVGLVLAFHLVLIGWNALQPSALGEQNPTDVVVCVSSSAEPEHDCDVDADLFDAQEGSYWSSSRA